MKTKNIVIIIFTLLLTTSFTQSSSDVLTSIENLLSEHFNSIKSNPIEDLTELGGGWVKEKFQLEGDYKYDVQQTNSLVSPYTAYSEFTIKRSFTNFHTTKEEAAADNSFIPFDFKKHKHYYAYQKGKWIVTKREHEGYNGQMSDCNEIISEENNAGQSNIFGCWELNFNK